MGSSTPASTEPPLPMSYTFPGIQKLKPGSGKDGIVVAKELQMVYEDLFRAKAKFACKRLMAVDPEVDALRFDAIREIVAPTQVLQELEEMGGRASRWISLGRNIFALFPLLLTWLALGLASLYYHEELVAHNELIGTPFLDLWQTGFGGHLWLTFERTAYIDLGFLGFLVVLTLLLHWAEGREQRTAANTVGRLGDALASLAVTMQRYEKKVKKADLESVAEDIGTALRRVEASMNAIVDANEKIVNSARDSMDIAREQVETFVSGLSKAVTATLDTLKVEYQTFIGSQTSAASTIFTEAREQTRRLFVDQVAPTISDFSSASASYISSAGTLSSAADALSDSARTLGSNAGAIDGHLVDLNTNIANVGLEAGGMREAAHGVIDNNIRMAEMIRAAGEVTQRLDTISELLDEASEQLGEASQRLDAASERFERTASRVFPPRRPTNPPPLPPPPPRAAAWWNPFTWFGGE